MNWDDLRLFLAVARSGSISSGARQLGLQHSTVSRRMRRFEQDIGARLFDKVPTGYELTAAGEHLLEAAERMEREILSVDGSLAGSDHQPSGPLHVTAIDNMATTVLMPMFVGFSRAFPEVTLHLMVSNSDVSLARREADVAIRMTNTPPETLVGRRAATVSSAVYGSPSYLEALRASGEEPQWLGVDCCVFHRSWTRQVCGEQTPQFVVDDTLLTQAALREGMGVSILPCFMGDADPGLARLGDPRPEWDLGLWILLHPDLKRTARVLAFRDYMTEAIAAKQPVFAGRLEPGAESHPGSP
ncbi:MAG: LysR family transcriptional regulator [Gammaproteobacteria bacterium]|nr:MAG: LysR family transcriptional regulator [Gammaproteobacteria bacterium]